jgi:mono/diheme cytochrome c family protein
MKKQLNRKWHALQALGLAIACLSVVAAISAQQNQPAAKPAAGEDQQFTPLIHSVEGPDLFRAYCASCHGLDGRGAGPAASELKVKPPDLTLLSWNNRGQFPAVHVRDMITGEQMVAAHGSREMPVWGPVFHQVEEDVDRGHVRVENLVKYIESIQEPGPNASPSGAVLYKRYCAACHGNDLKGNGPAPPPFRDYPPDLTTLAKRNKGVFPEGYIEKVLRNGVTLPAHGPAEMPIWGLDFRASEGLSQAEIDARIKALTIYIESYQVK